ncbi:unnamed protein product [Closterium sp. NIES-53]
MKPVGVVIRPVRYVKNAQPSEEEPGKKKAKGGEKGKRGEEGKGNSKHGNKHAGGRSGGGGGGGGEKKKGVGGANRGKGKAT